MTTTNQQVKKLMKNINLLTQEQAAAKAAMDVKTARKYLKIKKLPSELKTPHNWQNRIDVFSSVWQEIETLLTVNPKLQAKTVLIFLQQKYPGQFSDGQIRTLQRRFKIWRAKNGENKSIIFSQNHIPGKQSQSDFTNMNDLMITISGEKFNHLLFHFMLVYSRWESVTICYQESFASLAIGYENAVWSLGYVAPEHRTDNLTAATKQVGGTREFNKNWLNVMNHYSVTPSRNNPGESQENGSIEKSHDLFKNAVDQALMLRGSRDFKNLDEYEKFLKQLVNDRNASRQNKLILEIPKLKELPNEKWTSPKILPVRVSPSSTVQIESIAYSVPSRLISYTLMAHVSYDKIQLYYGQKCLQEMPKALSSSEGINYRHIIDMLVRKPGAFENYQYKEAFFPRLCFRQTYDALTANSKSSGTKNYLQILQLAKMLGEEQVALQLELQLKQNNIPSPEKIRALLNSPVKIPDIEIKQPELSTYSSLLKGEVRQ